MKKNFWLLGLLVTVLSFSLVAVGCGDGSGGGGGGSGGPTFKEELAFTKQVSDIIVSCYPATNPDLMDAAGTDEIYITFTFDRDTITEGNTVGNNGAHIGVSWSEPISGVPIGVRIPDISEIDGNEFVFGPVSVEDFLNSWSGIYGNNVYIGWYTDQGVTDATKVELWIY